MEKSDIKLPVVFTEITWDDSKALRLGRINTQNLILKAMEMVTREVTKHGGKIVQANENQVFCTFPNTKKAIQAACSQQRSIEQESLLEKINTSLRIGLHYGTVKISKDDVSGDAVSIARKIKTVAQANQILLSRDTMQDIPVALNIQMHTRGKLKVK